MKLEGPVDWMIFSSIVTCFAILIVLVIALYATILRLRAQIHELETRCDGMYQQLFAATQKETLVDQPASGRHRDVHQPVAAAEELMAELWRAFPHYQLHIGPNHVKVAIPHSSLVEMAEEEQDEIMRTLQFLRVHFQQHISETYFRDDEFEGARTYTFIMKVDETEPAR